MLFLRPKISWQRKRLAVCMDNTSGLNSWAYWIFYISSLLKIISIMKFIYSFDGCENY